MPITVVRAGSEVRTVGDDSPTGVGSKPTGEELLKMEGVEKSRNRLDRLFGEAFKGGDDVYDMAGATSLNLSRMTSSPGRRQETMSQRTKPQQVPSLTPRRHSKGWQ